MVLPITAAGSDCDLIDRRFRPGKEKLTRVAIPMKSTRLSATILALLYIGYLGCWAWSASHLPDPVATHFDARGVPNGWMTRSGNNLFMLIFGLAFPLFIVVLSYAARFLPSALINIPHREYWLAPEKRLETSNYLVWGSSWLACLAVWFVTGILLSVVDANQRTPARLSVPILLGSVLPFLVGTVIWLIALVRHFNRTSFPAPKA